MSDSRLMTPHLKLEEAIRANDREFHKFFEVDYVAQEDNGTRYDVLMGFSACVPKFTVRRILSLNPRH